jgi:hypothetical protein
MLKAVKKFTAFCGTERFTIVFTGGKGKDIPVQAMEIHRVVRG